MLAATMLCASCGETTSEPVCEHCGEMAVLGQRYVLDEALGQSAQGRTYAGRRLDDGLEIVAKELAFRDLDGWDAVEHFRREAAILRQLEHVNVPRYLDELETGQGKHRSVWLVQTRVPGEDLEARMTSHRYDEAEVWTAIASVAETLAYLHERRPAVVHRDIKPSNIVRRTDGSHALVDFGAVRDAIDPTGGNSTVTGTFGYMAPEQMRGEATPATDVYALGATALRLLTREKPQAFVRHDGSLDTSRLEPLSQKTKARLRTLMATDPERRPQDGRAVVELLARKGAASDRARTMVPARSSREALPPPPVVLPDGEPDSRGPVGPPVLTALPSIGVGLCIAGFALGFGFKVGVAGILLIVFGGKLANHERSERRRRRMAARKALLD